MSLIIKEDRIIRIAARGDGVTETGRHVSLAAPGDVIGTDGAIRHGAHHRDPPCRHFPECGGCQLQHLDDESWSAFLVDRISGALAQHGLTTDILEPVLSPPHSRRRATLHAERRGRQISLGFTESGSHRLVDMMMCSVLHPDLFRLLQPLRGLLAAMLPRNGRADVHLARVDQGVDILLTGVTSDGLANAEAVIAFAQRHRLARLALDEGMGPETRWEPDPVTITLGEVPVPMPHGAFLQATAEGEATLIAAVRSIVGNTTRIADLFAGLGTFSLTLPGAARVYAAEASRDTILSLKAAANAARSQIFCDHRDLYRRPLTADECGRFDVVLLDPPRAGAREQIDALSISSTPKIGYISCNPSTFARDAAKLCEGGYRLDWLRPVGQFRWSTHIELAAQFSR